MVDEANKELRRIRIALVFIAIFILFSAGERTITVDQDSNFDQPNLSLSNMVQLGDGYFGVLSSSTNDDYQTLKIYFFDKDKNKLIFIKENDLNDEGLTNEE